MSASLPPDFVYKKRKFHHIVTEFERKNYHVLKKNYVLSQKINVKIVMTFYYQFFFHTITQK